MSAVARWEVALLGNAVATLGSVGERLVSWRGRMEGVGRTLETTECWQGPAGAAAAGSLRRVSTVVTETTAALVRSLEDADRMVAAARTATELAGEALAAAAAIPVALDEAGRPGALPPVPLDPALDPAQALERQYAEIAEQAAAAQWAGELAGEALLSADRAALAAADAVAVLAGVGFDGRTAAADFPELVARVGLSGVAPPARPPLAPAEVAAWWSAMSEEQRLGWIEGSPGLIGLLDGVPAWARDRANRLLLADVVPGDPGFAVATATANEIRAREEAGEVVQLYQFDPGYELVALAIGNLDTADAVALVVPGVGNDPIQELDDVADDAAAVADAAVAAAPGLAVATVAWFGYRPPVNLAQGWRDDQARIGGAALDRTLDGVAATRAHDPARVTVVAHSYGTVVSDRAADAAGHLAADALVLAGSPGIDNDADGIEVDDVYEASAPFDPVTWLEIHGEQPADPDSPLDARTLPTEATMGHGDYFAADRPTLAAIGVVVAGPHEG
ncbi:Alpha/beta hydrolase [Trujillonella endophytica]|uniref:Alpha/beta hydrolase n=1 Tax=Trujillonella endophytica TaxID=673521 RepID=A0A1H8WKG0_9ACTN|nr:Alpha/beta hydrolase [Trujillella endophytica]